ncbi:MAG: acyl-CoA dehydrogenase [Actinobacteria bacterium]|nr:acyl-CoA dehydrogenase [Actinomycetota bacterium]
MSAVDETTETAAESVEELGARARAFIRANLRPLGRGGHRDFARSVVPDDEEIASVTRAREIQRMLWDHDLAGVCVPREYGGLGLTPAHQQALNEELAGYEFPYHLQTPTMSPCMAVLLDFGTHEQKLRHVPAILKGEEIWIQFLSEPSGGSDVAGALTTAVRDGDEWILNGSKVWSTGAWWSDWALCLARTNWDVPKHRGLTVFMFPIDQAEIEIQRIEMLNGNKEFCQEFMTDLRVPDTDRIGEVDQGWTVGIGWMFHERMAMAHNEPVITWPPVGGHGIYGAGLLVDAARQAARLDDPLARDLIGRGYTTALVGDPLQRRLGEGIAGGHLSDQAASIGRLYGWEVMKAMLTIPFELAGATGAAWDDDDGALYGTGHAYMVRQAIAIAGGTIEMARNVISERVLGMPREQSFDREVPFRDVPRGPTS